MKTLKNLVLAATLYAGCVGSSADIESEPRCSTITGLGIPTINNEISDAIQETMGFGFCTDIGESLAARERCMIASPYDGSIIFDPMGYLPEGQMFVKIAHEYAHILYNHIDEREYAETLLAWDNCVYMPRFNEMEREADHFAGYITAVAGKHQNDGIRFLTDAGNNRFHTRATSCQLNDMPDCVVEHYTNEQRVEEFMAGYNEVIPEE